MIETPIYRSFFRSPELCGKSGFYCNSLKETYLLLFFLMQILKYMLYVI